MTLLSVGGLRVERGGQAILSDLSLTVARGDRWGVVGRNGAGKTTLFMALTGELRPAAGTVGRAPDLTIALLDQERDPGCAATVWDVVAKPFEALLSLGRSLEAEAHTLEKDASPEALARYDRGLERFRREGGYEAPARVDRILLGLGFDPDEARLRSPSSLSGGEQGRLALARQLVAPADVLLMDEPTNHLDLETSRWLEEHLKTLDAAVLVVSHDRAFLDEVADHVLHLEAGTGRAYDCGYREFVEQRAALREARRRAVAKQRTEIAAEEEYIRRNIAGQNTRQARGRRTRLARLPRLSAPPAEADVMSLRLSVAQRGGDQVLVAEDLAVDIGPRRLLEGLSATLRRGEVLGVLGANGIGKTTLLRTLLGESLAAEGQVRLGAAIEPAYFRQDLSQVDPASSVFDSVYDLRPSWDRGQVQGHLGRFGFEGEEVLRKAGTLSGGERARLALALLMLSGANLLVLDEPTNHLDVPTIEVLEDAIASYGGTVILVSHDRALLRSVTTRVWVLKGGRAVDFPGGFADWEVRQEEAMAQVPHQEPTTRGQSEVASGHAKLHREARKTRAAESRSARRAVEAAESRVHELEERVQVLETALAEPGLYEGAGPSEVESLVKDLAGARRALEQALGQWEAVTAALADLED